MKPFYILLHDFNTNKVMKHDIMPYLCNTYKECAEKGHWGSMSNSSIAPTSHSDLVHFVTKVCMYRYWARCEYEWLMVSWPAGTLEDAIKIDAWEQIKMNLDIVVEIFKQNI